MSRPEKLYAFSVSLDIDGPICAVRFTSERPEWFDPFQEWGEKVLDENIVGSIDPWLFTACFVKPGFWSKAVEKKIASVLEDKYVLLTFDPGSLELLEWHCHGQMEQTR